MIIFEVALMLLLIGMISTRSPTNSSRSLSSKPIDFITRCISIGYSLGYSNLHFMTPQLGLQLFYFYSTLTKFRPFRFDDPRATPRSPPRPTPRATPRPTPQSPPRATPQAAPRLFPRPFSTHFDLFDPFSIFPSTTIKNSDAILRVLHHLGFRF